MKKFIKSDLNLNYDKAEFISGLEYCIKAAVNNYCNNTLGQGINQHQEREINNLFYETDITDRIWGIINNGKVHKS